MISYTKHQLSGVDPADDQLFDIRSGCRILLEIPDDSVIIRFSSEEHRAFSCEYFVDNFNKYMTDRQKYGGRVIRLYYKVDNDYLIDLYDWMQSTRYFFDAFYDRDKKVLTGYEDKDKSHFRISSRYIWKFPSMKYSCYWDNTRDEKWVREYQVCPNNGKHVHDRRVFKKSISHSELYDIRATHYNSENSKDTYTDKDLRFMVTDRSTGNTIPNNEIMTNTLIFHNGLLQTPKIDTDYPSFVLIKDIQCILQTLDCNHVEIYDEKKHNEPKTRASVVETDIRDIEDIVDEYRLKYLDDIEIVSWEGVNIEKHSPGITKDEFRELLLDEDNHEIMPNKNERRVNIFYPTMINSTAKFSDAILVFRNGEIFPPSQYEMSRDHLSIKLLNRDRYYEAIYSDMDENDDIIYPKTNLKNIINSEYWQVFDLSRQDGKKLNVVYNDICNIHDPAPFEIRFPHIDGANDLFFQDGALEYYEMGRVGEDCIRMRNNYNNLRGMYIFDIKKRKQIVHESSDFGQLYLT